MNRKAPLIQADLLSKEMGPVLIVQNFTAFRFGQKLFGASDVFGYFGDGQHGFILIQWIRYARYGTG